MTNTICVIFSHPVCLDYVFIIELILNTFKCVLIIIAVISNFQVVAVTEGTLWAMDRQSFRRIVLLSAFKKRKLYEALLERVPMLQTLDTYERMSLADALIARTYTAGECIIREGE